MRTLNGILDEMRVPPLLSEIDDMVVQDDGVPSTKQIPGLQQSNVVASLRDFLPMLKNLQERSERSPAIKQEQQEVIKEECPPLKLKIPLSLLTRKLAA